MNTPPMTLPLTIYGRPHGGPATADDWMAGLRERPQALLANLRGPFAVATKWDDGRVLLAVDRFAREPLCWTVRDGRLSWGQDAAALAGPRGSIDLQSIYDYLFFHVIPSPRTAFAEVHRLPPGCLAVWDGHRVDVQAYWVPAFEPGVAPASFDQARTEFRALLADAVREQLGDGIAACFLSGGTDSSTVAGLIGKVTGKPAETYSIGFEAEGYDEMAYARIAARHFGTRHHEYYVTPEDLVRHIPEVAAHYDQPFGNSSALPAYCCARMAGADGVGRLLAGDGGDELFGGNARYAKQRLFDLYARHLPAGLRQGVIEPLLDGPLGRAPGMRKAASYVQQARRPMPERTHLYNLLLRLGEAEVLEPGFRDAIDPGAPIRQQREVWDAAQANEPLNRVLAYDWRYTLAECDLPKVRGTTRLAGLEVGYPMLDERLVAFSQRLPVHWKLKGSQLRWFFKEALRGFLPDEILTKKKQGFGLPFGVWALRHDGLSRLAKEALEGLAGRGIVRPAFLRSLLESRLAEHPGYYGEMVWILMMLEQWFRGRAPDFRIDG